jgi:two-component system response regulator (stage 0 sporulation protein A)
MRILIADDDRMMCDMLREFVSACDHQVVAAVSGGGLAAIQSFTLHEPDVLLLDILMPRLNGFTVCHNVLSRNPNAKIVLMSGQVDKNYPSVTQSGAVAYLQKPFRLEDLREVLEAIGAIGAIAA